MCRSTRISLSLGIKMAKLSKNKRIKKNTSKSAHVVKQKEVHPGTETVGTVHLAEVVDELAATTEALVVHVRADSQSLYIEPEGYGERCGYPCPVLFEQNEGILHLVYWPDINSELPVIVPLDGALESRRNPNPDE